MRWTKRQNSKNLFTSNVLCETTNPSKVHKSQLGGTVAVVILSIVLSSNTLTLVQDHSGGKSIEKEIRQKSAAPKVKQPLLAYICVSFNGDEALF